MTIKTHITHPADAESTLIVQYMAVNPVDFKQPNAVQRLVSTVSQRLLPGESIAIDLIKGHSSISLHEGEPIVHLPLIANP